MNVKGEVYIAWANKINQVSELANLVGLKAQDLQLMKFCKVLNNMDRLYHKLMEIEPNSWPRAQDIIRETKKEI